MLCASCARSWVECQHFPGGESWPYVLPHSFTPISLSCCRAHSLSICDLTGHSPISSAAAHLFPWWTPLPPGHSIQPTIVKWNGQITADVFLFVSPASASLAWHCCSLPVLCGSLCHSWRAAIDHFLPGFPQKLTTPAALFFTLRCVWLTTAFCSHLLLPSTQTILSSLWSLSCDGFAVCTYELGMSERRAGLWAGGLFYWTLLKSSILSVWYK